MLLSELSFGSLQIWSHCNFACFTDLAISNFLLLQTYFNQGNSKYINKLCDMRTPHLHNSMCSGSKITALALLSQLILCKESVKTVYSILSQFPEQNFLNKTVLWY